MKLLSEKAVAELIPYSRAHRKRLEDAKQHPKRVRLGQGKRARVAWVESEILDYIKAKIADRDANTGS